MAFAAAAGAGGNGEDGWGDRRRLPHFKLSDDDEGLADLSVVEDSEEECDEGKKLTSTERMKLLVAKLKKDKELQASKKKMNSQKPGNSTRTNPKLKQLVYEPAGSTRNLSGSHRNQRLGRLAPYAPPVTNEPPNSGGREEHGTNGTGHSQQPAQLNVTINNYIFGTISFGGYNFSFNGSRSQGANPYDESSEDLPNENIETPTLVEEFMQQSQEQMRQPVEEEDMDVVD